MSSRDDGALFQSENTQSVERLFPILRFQTCHQHSATNVVYFEKSPTHPDKSGPFSSFFLFWGALVHPTLTRALHILMRALHILKRKTFVFALSFLPSTNPMRWPQSSISRDHSTGSSTKILANLCFLSN